MAEPAPVPKQGNHVFASVHDLLQKILNLLNQRIRGVYKNLATAQKLTVKLQAERYKQARDNLQDMMASLERHHNGQWNSQQLKHTDADTEPLKDQSNPIDQFGTQVMRPYLSSLEGYLTHRVSIKHHAADGGDNANHHANCKFDGETGNCLGILYEAQYRAQKAALFNGIIEHGQDKIALKRIQYHVRNLDAKNVSLQVKAHEQWVEDWEGLINRAVVVIDAAVNSAITLYDEMMKV